ncbi:FkbM family methyltransferase [Phyllobacterium myrsinacearum]|uniref:FkbM family methyltransferase n=1 Tax=Phyllobacterium myrsinacearum TaxID=28101 RepID=A0A839ENB3_9HYPH|nr:FkbM family methyltransferase [Phyllobacterium myrsinacearum]MBA8878926.1 FkbM family methyltransferase [Phyllobacterium myrsinacearum]
MSEVFEPFIARERIVGPHKFDVHIEDDLARKWYSYPNQWQTERQWWIDTIQPGWMVLDCGAHQGLTTVLLALCTGPTGTVHAWEASPNNATMIKRNAKLNKLKNIVVHPRAVGDRKGMLPVLNNDGAFLVLPSDQDPRMSTKVEVVRLDDDYDHSRKVDFLKIDVDGAELEVMLGAPRILSDRPYVNLEIHNYLFDNPVKTMSKIVEIFHDLEYSFKLDGYDGKEVVDAGVSPDVAWLTSFKFAQLFCTPV